MTYLYIDNLFLYLMGLGPKRLTQTNLLSTKLVQESCTRNIYSWNYFVDKSCQLNENLTILMNERLKSALNAGNRCCVVCYSSTLGKPVV